MDVVKSDEVADADVLLYHGNSMISRLIRFFDGTDVNHAAICIGRDEIGEAQAKGLTRDRIDGRLNNGEYIIVRRTKNNPGTMQPVVDKAEYYLGIGNKYAFEQIFLLAFLGLSRKLPANAYLKWLLRKVLDQAADWLTSNGERQPMICSEFVYRCYNEALPADQDPYSISIEPFTAPVSRSSRGFRSPAAARRNSIHRGSLLAWVGDAVSGRDPSGSSALLRTTREMGARGFAPSPSAEDNRMSAMPLDDLILDYLAEVRKPSARSFAAEASLRTPEMLGSIERLGAALYSERGSSARKSTRRVLAASTEDETLRNLSYLVKTAADFVTPGDLLKCIDLYDVGQIIPQD